MIEYHVDTHEELRKRFDSPESLGGNLSVRFHELEPPLKPLLIFGQDESIVSQFLSWSRHWVDPTGKRVLMPKTEGEGLMLSAYQSREFGFSYRLSQQQLDQVNLWRRGKEYHDKEGALEVLGTVHKQQKILTETPFLKLFEYGENRDGYWNSSHMSVQFEDCIDAVQCLFPQFDTLWLFDHSQSHDKKRKGALDAKRMSYKYGNKQQYTRPTVIEQAAGYLGTHSPLLSPGDTQTMSWPDDENELSSDDGPFWMTPAERLETRYAREDPEGKTRKREKTKDELVAELRDYGLNLPQKKYTKKTITEFATANNLPLHVEEVVVSEGWIGKPKGLLQICRERGLLDLGPNGLGWKRYSINGKLLPDGSRDKELSLVEILSSCTDFLDEETALEHLGRSRGVMVDKTPKFHAELAGEGIEYSWGFLKGKYRRLPLEDKKGKSKFLESVRKCIEQTQDNIPLIRSFARRARDYMLTFFILSNKCEIDENDGGLMDSAGTKITYDKIEKLKKQVKTHRSAVDFDSQFINHSIQSVEDET